MLKSVSSENLEYLKKFIEKMNKKAEKCNAKPIEIVSISNKIIKSENNDFESYEVYDIEIEHDLISLGKEFKILAQIEHISKNNNVINLIDQSYQIEEKYYKVDCICEHCNINRYRKFTYLLENEKKEIVQIGKTCLKDYTGYNVENFLTMIENIENLENLLKENAENMGFSGKKLYNINDILNITKLLIDDFGYISSKKADENCIQSTKSLIIDVLNRDFTSVIYGKKLHDVFQKFAENKGNFEDVKNALEWIQGKTEKERFSNPYINNIYVLSKNSYVEYKNIGYVSSILASYYNEMNKNKEKEEKEKGKQNSSFIGEIGEKLEMNVRFISKKSFDTMYGLSNLYLFADENENIIKWFSSTYFEVPEKDYFKVKFTVKSHDEWNNQKQTSVTRLKAI